MAHTVWSGAVSFGLVNVPVKAKVATRQKDVRFVQLHGEDGERVKMLRTCPEHGEIPYDEVVRGYPLGKHEYVIVTDDEFRSVEPERQETIEIEDFVELSEVDPVYFDKTYHLVPEQAGAKAYQLLVRSLAKTGRVAIGRFVMRNKEHLVALRVWDDGLVMETLHFHDEVVPPDEVREEVSAREPSDKEKEMAERLIESLSTPFAPDTYKDEHRERLLELIERKAEGQTVTAPERPTPAAPVEDLEKALEESLRRIAGS